jgi:HK97 family phage portal protein
MRIFGIEFGLKRVKAQTMALVPSSGGGGFFGIVREAWAGAFQQHMVVDAPRTLLAFSAVFSCVTGIATDISKLRIKLVEEDDNDICTELEVSPFLGVLRKPNRYQNRIQFLAQWIISKLLYGNAYAIKERDQRGVVVALYLLDAQRVKPMVAEDGGVYYELAADHLAGLQKTVTVPASEIIHDRWNCLWHPLVGISPIYACGVSATMGNRIQANSTTFFNNMSRPSGQLTAPGTIAPDTAIRLKTEFENNFSGSKIGRLLVAGDGLHYEPMTIPAEQAQLIEQLKWTVEDVARCFHYPLFKLGGALPPATSIEALNQAYYTDCLQGLIESLELSLDEGLALPVNYYTLVDLDGLLRMDTASRYAATETAIRAGWMAPNEARARENMKPVKGGESPMIQQQNFSLAALAKRDAKDDPFGTAPAPAPAAKPDAAANDDDDEDNEQAAALADQFIRGMMAESGAERVDRAAVSATLLDVDSQIRASVGIVTALASNVTESQKRVDSTLEAVVAAARHTEQSQARVAKSVDDLSATLKMPVVPIFDKAGMLKGSRRVENLEDES